MPKSWLGLMLFDAIERIPTGMWIIPHARFPFPKLYLASGKDRRDGAGRVNRRVSRRELLEWRIPGTAVFARSPFFHSCQVRPSLC